MIETGTTAMAVDAGRTLLLDKDSDVEKRANEASLSIVAYPVYE